MPSPDRIPQATIEAIAQRMVEVRGGAIRLLDEGTRRRWDVELEPFLLSAVHLTREHYRAIVGEAPGVAAGPQTPVTEVSWSDAVALCNRLSTGAGLRPCYSGLGDVDAEGVLVDPSADGYRLPTEAEWEHACRAGSSEPRYGELDAIAWHLGNSNDEIHDVGGKRPNAWEWCWDLFDPAVYGPYRVFRGGGFADRPRGCRASCRRKSHPTLRIEDVGIRLARSRLRA